MGDRLKIERQKAGAPPSLEKRRENFWFETQFFISFFLLKRRVKKSLSSENALVLFCNHLPSLAPNERLTLCLANTYTNTLNCQTHICNRTEAPAMKDGMGGG